MKISKIKELVSQKNWNSLTTNFSAKDVCLSLNFREAMRLTEELFYNNMQDDALQQFALSLAFEIKEHFKNQWETDWKNDIFLGYLCSILWLYKERYICYKRAYDKLTDPPEALLLLLAGCRSAPGVPPISEQASEKYLMKAIEKKVTYEAALMMRSLYHNKADHQMEEYWDKICKELELKNIHTEAIIPDVLRDI